MQQVAASIEFLFPGRITIDMLVRKVSQNDFQTSLGDQGVPIAKKRSTWRGKLYNKMWNLKKRRNKLMASLGKPDIAAKLLSVESSQEASTSNDTVDENVVQLDINFLQSASVFDAENIKTVLARTISYRKERIVSGQLLPYKFNFFYIEPNLVTYEFGLWFPSKEFMLLSKNDSIKEAIRAVYVERDLKELSISTCPGDLEVWAMLLKMTQYTGKGKKSFPFTLQSLFTYYQAASVSLTEIVKKRHSNFPHVAILQNSSSPESVNQYGVYFEGQVIALPRDSSIDHAIDILFKISWIFNYHYDPILLPFFSFLENVVYEINHKIHDNAKHAADLVKHFLQKKLSQEEDKL